MPATTAVVFPKDFDEKDFPDISESKHLHRPTKPVVTKQRTRQPCVDLKQLVKQASTTWPQLSMPKFDLISDNNCLFYAIIAGGKLEITAQQLRVYLFSQAQRAGLNVSPELFGRSQPIPYACLGVLSYFASQNVVIVDNGKVIYSSGQEYMDTVYLSTQGSVDSVNHLVFMKLGPKLLPLQDPSTLHLLFGASSSQSVAQRLGADNDCLFKAINTFIAFQHLSTVKLRTRMAKAAQKWPVSFTQADLFKIKKKKYLKWVPGWLVFLVAHIFKKVIHH